MDSQKKKKVSSVQRVRKYPAQCYHHFLLCNMSIRKSTAAKKKPNFKAIWWVNISSLLFKFNFYPALKSISLANHYKARLSEDPFCTSPKRLNSKIYFSRYLCFISQIVGILWKIHFWNFGLCARSLDTRWHHRKRICYYRYASPAGKLQSRQHGQPSQRNPSRPRFPCYDYGLYARFQTWGWPSRAGLLWVKGAFQERWVIWWKDWNMF